MNIPNKEFLEKNWRGDPYKLAEIIMYPKIPNPAKIEDIWFLVSIEEKNINKKVFEFARYIMESEREWNPAPPFKPKLGWVKEY